VPVPVPVRLLHFPYFLANEISKDTNNQDKKLEISKLTSHEYTPTDLSR
jgi:hypothetical protein